MISDMTLPKAWPVTRGLAASALALVAISAGCANPDSAVGFDQPDTAARMRAIRTAAANNDVGAVPALIGRLESDDPAERLLAQRTLEKLTGESQGYEYAASKQERDAAVDRWVAWQAARSGGLRGGVSTMTRGEGGEHSP
jgi:hypothetical protein